MQAAATQAHAMNDPKRELARRNLRLALWLAAVALGFFLAFFWSMSHR
jgi:hypothetical protein